MFTRNILIPEALQRITPVKVGGHKFSRRRFYILHELFVFLLLFISCYISSV